MPEPLGRWGRGRGPVIWFGNTKEDAVSLPGFGDWGREGSHIHCDPGKEGRQVLVSEPVLTMGSQAVLHGNDPAHLYPFLPSQNVHFEAVQAPALHPGLLLMVVVAPIPDLLSAAGQ